MGAQHSVSTPQKTHRSGVWLEDQRSPAICPSEAEAFCWSAAPSVDHPKYTVIQFHWLAQVFILGK